MMITILNKADEIIFTSGIGENDKVSHREIMARLSLFGFNIDDELNQSNV